MLSALVLLPLLAACLLPILRSRDGQNALAVATVVLVLVGLLSMAPAIVQGEPASARLPGLLGHFHFLADPFGLVFALVGTFVWLSATIYATAYLGDDPARPRFLSICLVLLAANLGVFLAADLLTLFVFFELLGLVAVLVVVHSGSEEARSAGITYFWMTLAGGIALLAAVLAVQSQAGSLAWQPLPEAVSSGWRWTIFGLMLVGFGVKAGMVPLHIWLPAAHPVAPAPASAILSGVIIKAGAYGLFRCMNMLMSASPGTSAWSQAVDMGLVLTLFGIATLVIGVVLALGQHSAKRMLAWHSVSQMGFVITGLGLGAFLAGDGAMATAGGLLHVVNHALFKSCLFLGAGAVALRTGSADMYRLGGLWRDMPVTFTCMLIAAAGITGMPLFNGFVSKCMIHHGLVEAGQREGGQVLVYAEWLYLAACAGTAASFIKFIGLIFLKRPRQPHPVRVREAHPAMLVGMLLPIIPIAWLGWRPHGLLESVFSPALAGQGISPQPITYYLEHYFLSGQDLAASVGMLGGGLVVFVAGMKFGWFTLSLPRTLGVAWWYRRMGVGMIDLCLRLARLAAAARAAVPERMQTLYRKPSWRAAGRLVRPGRSKLPRDALFEALNRQRDRLLGTADRLARRDQARYPGDALVNSSHMFAGWLGTELVRRGMVSHRGTAAEIAADETFCQKLAERAVGLARKQLDEGLETVEIQQALSELDPVLGPDRAPSDHNWPERRWPAELADMALAPDHAHWPVSESLAQGALIRAVRGRVRKVAQDLSTGLLVAFLILMLLGLFLMSQ